MTYTYISEDAVKRQGALDNLAAVGMAAVEERHPYPTIRTKHLPSEDRYKTTTRDQSSEELANERTKSGRNERFPGGKVKYGG